MKKRPSRLYITSSFKNKSLEPPESGRFFLWVKNKSFIFYHNLGMMEKGKMKEGGRYGVVD